MTNRGQNSCPECRQPVTAGNKNAHLCLLIQNILDKKSSNKNIVNSAPPVAINITVNRNNRYLNQYMIQDNRVIVKGGEYAWYGLLFNEVIPAEGKFMFCVEVVYSLHNNIEIGLIDVASRV